MMKGTHRAAVPTTGRGWILRTNRHLLSPAEVQGMVAYLRKFAESNDSSNQ